MESKIYPQNSTHMHSLYDFKNYLNFFVTFLEHLIVISGKKGEVQEDRDRSTYFLQQNRQTDRGNI
jgi:hypothetical protein